jgi:hypothetical protein
MDAEKELVDAFDRIVHQDFPNPQRINCPEHDSLLKLATHIEDSQFVSMLAHIGRCALCFDELKAVRRNSSGLTGKMPT